MSESAYNPGFMISNVMPSNGITAKQSMQYQEYLSNTAHQRQMADLKAAGLNPWLADTSGASVPSGQQDSAEVLQLLNGISDVLDSAHSGRNVTKATDETAEAFANAFDEVLGAVKYLFPKGLRSLVTLSSYAGFSDETKALIDEKMKDPEFTKKLRDKSLQDSAKKVHSAFIRALPFRRRVKRSDFTKY